MFRARSHAALTPALSVIIYLPTSNSKYARFSSSKNCKYHVIFVPKRRRKVLYGELRQQLKAIFHELARQKECQQANALLLEILVIPGIRFFGWVICPAEFWIFLSMLLGLLSRLGALISIGVIGQLYVGLANIPRPYEWEWAYGAILLPSVVLLGAAADRFLGMDGWLRPRLAGLASRGSILARIALRLS